MSLNKTKKEFEMGRLDGLMLWQLMNINDKIPTAEEVAKAIVDEEVKRREDEKAYWREWDKACKEGVIKRLRDPNDILNLLTLNQQPIYEGISKEKQAALIEGGELKIVAQTQGAKPIISSMWVDDSREEAQNPTYRKLKAINLKEIEQGIRRVVM